MTTPPISYSPSAVRVLADPALWCCIVSFQQGLPMPLYQFWVKHEPSIATLTGPNVISAGFPRLLRLVVAHGTVQQLEDLSAVKFYMGTTRPADSVWSIGCYSRWEAGSLASLGQLAVEFNRADMLQWASAHEIRYTRDRTFWRSVIKHHVHGDYRVLDLLCISHPMEAIYLADHLIDDLDLLRWLDERFPRPVDIGLLENAASKGHLAMVEYILDKHPTFHVDARPLQTALAMGHLDVARCLLERRPAEFDREYFERFIRRVNKHELKILADVGGFEGVAREVGMSYVHHGQLERLQDLLDSGLLPSREPFSIDRALQNNLLYVIEFLTERNLATASTNALDLAARTGGWDLVMYLHEHWHEGCTTAAMDTAATYGHLKKLRFFHENRTEGCTTRAMDAAAANGYLPIVKFLHENRSEGCTTDAMDDAAGGGHLLIVKYLHANRTEGCTIAAVEKALKNGFLEVVRFLYRHCRSLFGPDLLHDLLLRGAFDIWKELREIYPDKAAEVVELCLLNAGAEKELATINFIIHELGRDDLAPVAVDGAGLGIFYGHSQWPRVVWTIAGPGSCRLSAVRNAVYSTSLDAVPHELQFLISVCSESGASEVAIEVASESRLDTTQSGVLEAWVANGCQLEVPAIHPLLLDPRCPGWAVNLALSSPHRVWNKYQRWEEPLPWPIQAICRGDGLLLEILRGVKSDDRMYSFERARAAAIRTGNLPLLQWLLSNSDLPVEPTLLDEAPYYHQFEIAEWLAANCLDGCREFNWDIVANCLGGCLDNTRNFVVTCPDGCHQIYSNTKLVASWHCLCGLVDGILLQWIEDHAAVRDLVDFGEILFYAAMTGDMAALRQLHRTHPELYTSRHGLANFTGRRKDREVPSCLKEINFALSESSSTWRALATNQRVTDVLLPQEY